MNTYILLLRKTWRMLFYINAIVVFLILFPLFFIFIQREEWLPIVFRLKRFCARLMLCNVGIRCSVKFEEPLDKNKVYIYCPNHTSYMDILVSYLVIPQYFHFMAKAELTQKPLFNIFFKTMDIPVNRSSLRDSHKAFHRAASDIKKGISIAIFPEATIPNLVPRLGNFKNGPFKLAIDTQTPIVPITFINNWTILPDGRKKKKGGRPGRAEIVVHKPIEIKGMTEDDVLALKNQVFTVINNTVRKKEK